MYRIAVRSAARRALRTLRTSPATRRFASTNVPADRPRSWKSSALRWGLVGGAIYYYNTSPVFADEAGPQTVNAPPPFNDSELPTVDSVLEEKRRQIQSNLEKRHAASPAEKVSDDSIPARTDGVASGNQDGPQGLEEQAGQEGAFNPETGEINWDCPCLGGMAHGPCGEDFKTAFSCFVYSEEEPKGMDCIDKFQSMQDCFRQYPEIYGAELEGEDAAVAEDEAAEAAAFDQQSAAPVKVESDDHQILRDATPPVVGTSLTDQTPGSKEPASATSTAIPANWDDAREANFDADKKENPAEAEKKEEEKKQ